MPAKIDLKPREIVEALGWAYGVPGLAARRLGVSRQTLMRRLQNDAALRKACEETSQAIKDDLAYSIIVQTAKLGIQGHWPAMKWYLNTFATDRGFGHRRQRLGAARAADVITAATVKATGDRSPRRPASEG